MASTSISAPMRGATLGMRRLPQWQAVLSTPYSTKSLLTPCARSMSTSTPSRAAVSAFTTSSDGHVTVKPFEEQTVLATIHKFPSLEPLRFERYPANHLHLPTRRDILHRAVIYEGDMTRLGTASTKTRYEVRGSARKVRPQKGSGHARLGDRKSPMLRGGGVAFGPRPRDFSSELQKKVYDLAWRTALSYRFRKGELIIVDNAMEIESPSARLLGDIFKYQEKICGRGRSLLVTLEERPLLEQALVEMGRGEQTLTWEEVDVKNLLELSRVMIERDALHNILLMHEEDLTHKAIQPWHKSLVRSSPPSDLESIIGWQEFRALTLTDPKEKEAVRANAYETVASARYTYAESLAPGPKRSELTVSAYRLLAEAKEIQFTEKTGFPFREYNELVEKSDASDVASQFPRIQALDYQVNLKTNLAETAAETSRLKAEEISVEIRTLEVEKLEIQYDAALLAAQVYEHIAEAKSLAGEVADSESTLSYASTERTNVDVVELQTLEAKVEVAKQEHLVASLKGSISGQKKAQEKIRQYTAALESKQAEAEVLEDLDGEQEVELPIEVEEPRESSTEVKSTNQEKR